MGVARRLDKVTIVLGGFLGTVNCAQTTKHISNYFLTMGQGATCLFVAQPVEIVKRDINIDYDTYGREGDVDYVTDQNQYYELDYDDMETAAAGQRGRPQAGESRCQESMHQPGNTPKRILLIFCTVALILVIGAGATSTILFLPSLLQQENSTTTSTTDSCATDGAWGSWSDYGE